MTPVGTVHLVFSLLAVLFGAIVLRLPKGTRWHRTWGQGYCWMMIGVVATSFSMYGLTGHVTPFHGAALVAAITLAGGMWTVLRRRPRADWIRAHAMWMAWSYIGLCAALVAESMTRFAMPALQARGVLAGRWALFWSLVVVGSVAVIETGKRLIRSHLDASVAGAPAAMREDRL